MDLQKEREAFEAVTSIYHCIYNADLNYYFSGSKFVGNKAEIEVNAGWKAWQAAKAESHKSASLYQFEINHLADANQQWRDYAAKAQAVPEGFVLVSKTPSLKVLDRLYAEHDIDEERATYIYRDIIDAQEPAND